MKEIIGCSFGAGLDFVCTRLFYFTIRQRLIWKILFSGDANNFFSVKLIALKFTVYDPFKHKPVFQYLITQQAIKLPIHTELLKCSLGRL